MTNLPVLHFDHVETHVRIAYFLPQKIKLRDLDVAPPLLPVYGIRAAAVRIARARFHLDEHERCALFRHDVRFARGRSVIGLYDLITRLYKIFSSEPLSLFSQNFFVKVLR